MKLNIDKKTAALVLFGAAVLLLISNLVAGIFMKSHEELARKEEINSAEIDSLFLFSIHSFGISNDWVTERKSKKINKSYLVKVPADLSIPVILMEMNSNFSGKDVEIISEEKKFSDGTETGIYVGKEIWLKSEFQYDDNIHRPAGTVSFILKDYELTSSRDSSLLNIPEPFSPLLMPSTENHNISKFITEKKKTFSILLDDNITDIKYKLRDNYSQNRIKATLFTIINDFSSASFFVIDDNSDLYNSDVFAFIRKELEKRNISLLKLSELADLESETGNLMKNDFDNLLKNMNDGQSLIIVVNYKGFEELIPEIKRFRKIGYKIVHPSQLIQKEK